MLGDRLKAARKFVKMTQKQVASSIGVTESAYCGYETGKRQPDALKIKQLSEVLNVSGNYLLGIDELPAKQKNPTSVVGDGKTREFVELFEKLDDGAQKTVISALKGILSEQE